MILLASASFGALGLTVGLLAKDFEQETPDTEDR
jgi:hypothetical protein